MLSARIPESEFRKAADGWEKCRAQVARLEAELEDALDSEWESVNASIWNLEQCPSEDDHCNDVTRVHDRLLKRREELDHILHSKEGE